jgi:hypothetical protein
VVEPTTTEQTQHAAGLAAAARAKGVEQVESAKGRLADGADRVASGVERTADDLEGDGDGAVSGFGRSVASLMRQLAGGLRERDVEEFASELGALARRNPAVFLAGSVALGFGVARFFKARAPQRNTSSDRRSEDGRDGNFDAREFDADETLDLSGNPSGIDRRGEDESTAFEAARSDRRVRTEPPRATTEQSTPSERSATEGEKP